MDVSSFIISSLDQMLKYLIAWSAPSAIGTAGLGVGGQAGAEVTDFLIVLNSWSVCSIPFSHHRFT